MSVTTVIREAVDVGHFCPMTCVGTLVLGNACALTAQTGFDPQVYARKSNPSVCVLASLKAFRTISNLQMAPVLSWLPHKESLAL